MRLKRGHDAGSDEDGGWGAVVFGAGGHAADERTRQERREAAPGQRGEADSWLNKYVHG